MFFEESICFPFLSYAIYGVYTFIIIVHHLRYCIYIILQIRINGYGSIVSAVRYPFQSGP